MFKVDHPSIYPSFSGPVILHMVAGNLESIQAGFGHKVGDTLDAEPQPFKHYRQFRGARKRTTHVFGLTEETPGTQAGIKPQPKRCTQTC